MKLSVVIPVYNGEAFIKRCIDSLLCQNVECELEIVVINDGSTDRTLSVLSSFDNIHVFTIKNGGAAMARNEGLLRATGDFVMFLDADDALDTSCLSFVTRQQRLTDADIVRFGYRIVTSDKSHYVKPLFPAITYIKKPDFSILYKKYITGISLNSICMTIFKKSVLSGIVFRTDMKTAEDAVFSMNAYTRAESALFIPEPYYIYYRQESGLTGHGLSVSEKYRCNFIYSKEILAHLPEWKMNTPVLRSLTRIRPVTVTLSKLARIFTERH